LGGHAIIANGTLSPDDLTQAPDFGGVIWWGDAEQARALAIGLSQRSGEIIPLITGYPDTGHAVIERHVCIDTTAAGGNAALLAGNA
jgi:RHH-type proline utilization regulon transcriptional repressor/proline dehydrogenase/delta 1-pyrroline-5-carboxylate dehydrogenase